MADENEFEVIEENLISKFSRMPDDEQVRFFAATATMLLSQDQLKSLVKILQGRILE